MCQPKIIILSKNAINMQDYLNMNDKILCYKMRANTDI